jgi:micrococcal nuclease
MSIRRLAPVLLALLALAVAVAGHASGGSPGGYGYRGGPRASVTPRSTVHARVLRVVDGDTVQVALGRAREKVRYIGIDTPEEVKPNTPVQCYARRAAARNEQLVDGRAVVLRFDANPRDRYGRLLAYVYRASDGLFVNAQLVREGAARDDPFPDNHAHAALFARLAATARSAGRGLWSACP